MISSVGSDLLVVLDTHCICEMLITIILFYPSKLYLFTANLTSFNWLILVKCVFISMVCIITTIRMHFNFSMSILFHCPPCVHVLIYSLTP